MGYGLEVGEGIVRVVRRGIGHWGGERKTLKKQRQPDVPKKGIPHNACHLYAFPFSYVCHSMAFPISRVSNLEASYY